MSIRIYTQSQNYKSLEIVKSMNIIECIVIVRMQFIQNVKHRSVLEVLTINCSVSTCFEAPCLKTIS